MVAECEHRIRRKIVCINREFLPCIPIAPERPSVRRDPFDDVNVLFLVALASTPAVPVSVAVDAHRDPPIPVLLVAEFDGCLVELHAVGAGSSLRDLQHVVGVVLSIAMQVHQHPARLLPVQPRVVWIRLGVNDGRHGDGQKRRHQHGEDKETSAAEMEIRISFAGESRHLAPSAERVHQEFLQRAGCAGSVVFFEPRQYGEKR